ncbi:RNA polymerase sigma-70 factor (family 1) [Chitinophaga niastensis]|uniref:RNA polymerase sigma-70 factor (Family 1) n=1 Tax=Chitinophaga niastensis TaxID=536980 RepID=A0A2P8HJZ9_CHINA|nr:RNA polymerase sigma-70 factor [Chitinophaga niastensis]PSL46547.1 RNA polymerase sigma-70 factor (family 1) [Chitinophaga niastensis]
MVAVQRMKLTYGICHLSNPLNYYIETACINSNFILFCAAKLWRRKRAMYQPNSSEPSSFEELFRLHYTFLCATAYYVVEDEDTAEDIVQDFFLYCWNKRSTIQITQNFKSYATRAIRNASLSYLKISNKIIFEEPSLIESTAAQLPNEDYEQEETRNAALWAAIGRLPIQRQRIFLLSNRDGLKYKDIATQLNISVNTVKTQIKLAYQYLRKECEWMIKFISIIFFLSK